MRKRAKKLTTLLLSAALVVGSLGSLITTSMHAKAATQFTGTHFDDGFDYFDSGKWHKAVDYSNGDMFYCTWRDANVAFNNGAMELKILSDDWATEYSRYSGGEYRSNETFHYGMYQVSMKPIKNDGVVSSFFTYTGPSDGTNWDEIDIEFLGKDTTKVQFNYYTNGVGGHEYVYDLGFDASQAYHTYGFYWADDYIAWYVDGVEVYRTPSSDASIIPDEPSRIMMNVWPGKGVDDWLNPYNGVTPLCAYYDWMSWYAPGTDGGSTDSGSTTTPAPDTSASPFNSSTEYNIISRHSGKALDVANKSTADGGNIIQYTLDTSKDNQKWYITKLDNGYYTITSKLSGKALDVAEVSTADGANIQQWSYGGGANQEWSIEDVGGGYYVIYNRNSGKCVDVDGASTADNANIHQWTYGGGYNQQWIIQPASGSGSTSTSEFDSSKTYSIISRHSGKALDVYYGLADNGTNVLQYTYNAYENQKWYITKLDNGYYTIKSKVSGKVLDVEGGSTADGANIQQWEYGGGYNQEWSIEDIGGGYYVIYNRNSGKCIDVDGASTADNANIHQWTYGGGYNQQWIISLAE